MTELLYNSKAMKVEPINISMQDAAAILRGGGPVVVELEPGDGTYYALMLVPLYSSNIAESLGRYGIQPAEAHHYLFVAKLESDGCDFIPIHANLGPYHFDELTGNDWSKQFLGWWFTELVEALNGQV